MDESMTFADAAYRLLDESSEPRHYRWLTEEALRRGWITTAGKTPEATMYAVLYAEIKNEIPGKRPSRFVKTGRGMFGLAEWEVEKPTPKKATVSTDVGYFVFVVNTSEGVKGELTARQIYSRLMKLKTWGIGKSTAYRRDITEGIRVVFYQAGKVGFLTQFMLFHRGSAAAAYDAYIAAANGDPSGLAIMSLMFDQMLPASVTWGEWAAKGFFDYAGSRDWVTEMNPPDSIIGSPVSLLAGGGYLGGSWPGASLPDWVHEPQPSDVETLLVGGNSDFSTPAQFATEELLPLLSNGQQVILSEMGHTSDVFGLQTDTMFHMLSTFFDTGEVDDSLFEYQPMSFDVGLSFPDVAHAIVNAAVAVGLLIVAALVVLF